MATVYWSYVEIGHIDTAELAALLTEAWARIVPKKVSRPYLSARAS